MLDRMTLVREVRGQFFGHDESDESGIVECCPSEVCPPKILINFLHQMQVLVSTEMVCPVKLFTARANKLSASILIRLVSRLLIGSHV